MTQLRAEHRRVPIESVIASRRAAWRTASRNQPTTLERAAVAAASYRQAILVRPASGGQFELIDGRRRFDAARRCGDEWIDVAVIQADDALASAIALVVHLGHVRLRAIEAALLCAQVQAALEAAGLPSRQEDVGVLVGMRQNTVSDHLQVARAFAPGTLEQVGLTTDDLAAIPKTSLLRVAKMDVAERSERLRTGKILKDEGRAISEAFQAAPKGRPKRVTFVLTDRADGRCHLEVRQQDLGNDALELLQRMAPRLIAWRHQAGIASIDELIQQTLGLPGQRQRRSGDRDAINASIYKQDNVLRTTAAAKLVRKFPGWKVLRDRMIAWIRCRVRAISLPEARGGRPLQTRCPRGGAQASVPPRYGPPARSVVPRSGGTG